MDLKGIIKESIADIRNFFDSGIFPLGDSEPRISLYIWTFNASEEGYLQRVAKEVEKHKTFFDGCLMAADCAIIKHPKRKEAVKIARKALLDNGFKEPFLPEVEGQMLKAVFYNLTA
jgi:hypothetical protein